MKIDKIKLSTSDCSNMDSCLPTWHKGEWLYHTIEEIFYFHEDFQEDWRDDIGFLSFVQNDMSLSPLQSMAANIITILDCYEKAYSIDRPKKSEWDNFTKEHIFLDLQEVKDEGRTAFKLWCVHYDKANFNKKKSFDDHIEYFDHNTYSFYKLSKLCYYLIRDLDFETWQDLYNWCIDLINGKCKIIVENV